MSDLIQLVVLDREDPSRNMARYYVLTIETTLFKEVALVREWGRIGRQGRRRLDLFESRAEAIEALEIWLSRKIQRGYRVRDNGTGPVDPGVSPARNRRIEYES